VKRGAFTAVLATSVVLHLAASAARGPDWAKMSISSSLISIRFGWDKDKADPGFAIGESVEFEVWMDPKCSAQPPGGRDDNTLRAATNIEDSYTDVWNYWAPWGVTGWIEKASTLQPMRVQLKTP